jgi:formylglycine-generating enzyme required for sulfatase activity
LEIEMEEKYSWGKNACLPEGTVSFEYPFQLTKYPVTNGQFRRFWEAGGYGDDSFWHQAGWRWREKNEIVEPLYWRDSKWNGPTQPVVGVSWWEADAFCRWAGCRLPTEREWEAAARGPEAWEYPWKGEWRDGICNSREADLGVTTPVGIFPNSAAVCGGHDMAGNVWEWCNDTFDPASADDPDAGRVLRGGSWFDGLHICRSAIRLIWLPDFRNYLSGFRVART